MTERQTHFSDLGSGPPLVLIHALGLNSSMWTLQVPVLGQRYRILRYDVRGHGRTPCDREPVSIESLSNDLLDLLDHLGIEEAAVVGLSMGGMIAQAFASSNPGRVSALALVSTMPTFPEAGRKGLLDRAFTVEQQGMEPMVAPALERWFTGEFSSRALASAVRAGTTEGAIPHHIDASGDAFETSIVGAISQMIRAADPHGYAAVCRALARTDLTEKLSAISSPTLILSGAADPGVSAESQDTLGERIPTNTQVVVPESSHLVPVERADEFNAHLLNFLTWCNYR